MLRIMHARRESERASWHGSREGRQYTIVAYEAIWGMRVKKKEAIHLAAIGEANNRQQQYQTRAANLNGALNKDAFCIAM